MLKLSFRETQTILLLSLVVSGRVCHASGCQQLGTRTTTGSVLPPPASTSTRPTTTDTNYVQGSTPAVTRRRDAGILYKKQVQGRMCSAEDPPGCCPSCWWRDPVSPGHWHWWTGDTMTQSCPHPPGTIGQCVTCWPVPCVYIMSGYYTKHFILLYLNPSQDSNMKLICI